MTGIAAPDSRASVMHKSASAYRYYVLGILFIAYALNFLDRSILGILLDPIKAELQVSDKMMGLLAGFAFVAFYSVLGVPIARWADRGSRRSILALGLAFWSGLTTLSGFAQSYAQMALARVGVGVGEAAGAPPSHALISDYFEKEKRPRAMAIFQSSIYLGLFLGYLMGGWISQLYGWRAAFWAAGLPGLALAGIVMLTVREPLRGAADHETVDRSAHGLGEVARFLAGQRAFVLIVLGVGLVAFTNFAFSVWSAPFLGQVHHMGRGEIGTYLGVIKGALGVVGTLVGGFAVEWLRGRDDRWLLVVTGAVTLLAGPAFLVFLLAADKYVALAGLGAATLCIAFHYGPCFAIAQTLVKVRMRSLAASILLLSVNLIGLGLGSFVVGLLNDLLAGAFGDAAVRYSLIAGPATCVLGAAGIWLASRTVLADIRNCEAGGTGASETERHRPS